MHEIRRQTRAERAPILLLDPNPVAAVQELGIDNVKVLFTRALGLPTNSPRILYANVVDSEITATLENVGGVIIAGSKFSAYEEYPNKPQLEQFVHDTMDQGIPLLGVCFGHQVINQALGGKVERGSKGQEIGPFKVTLTDEGVKDPLFEGVTREFVIMQSHGDVVTKLPERADIVVLGKTTLYDNQALAIGDRTRTIQFHPEETPNTVAQVIDMRRDSLLESGYVRDLDELEELLRNTREAPTEETGRRIVRNFVEHFVNPYVHEVYAA